MSGFRKRSPSGGNKAPPPLGREARQNPQRWRQAFGDLRPQGAGERRSDFAQRYGTGDANLVRRPDGSPEPLPPHQPQPPPLQKPPISVPDNVKRRLPFTPAASDSSCSMDGPPSLPQPPQSQSDAGASLAGATTRNSNPIWKSSFRRADDVYTRTEQPPPPIAPPQVMAGSDRELEELVTKPARTAEDRYKILDARDKLIRKRNPKVKVRVEFAIRLAGTCLDMCPEKERYMREVQRRLSCYECDPNQDSVVDHRLAIKEYSRSSADQEEPLPHDLRPIQALHLTLDYLLHNVINRLEDEDENLSELYCFIWDRTRAIRKDMTQQQLGTTEAVLLMEKCVRFHIYCSTRLCELDRHSFDPKLNDENLMKCLQSLEHMYEDLAPHGVKCPNEPEFRSYQILMHLNEGDIIREIQTKPAWILKSPPVEHALRIYVALNSMNSVAFFRLVESSSFMVSSILHRYFFQVRTNALTRFIKMYSLKGVISMPTMQVKRMLGFGSGDQDINTFKYFCESHGFTSRNIGESSMTLPNKSHFEQPQANLINREPWLIESKLTVSISEAINGCPLGQNPLLTSIPHSSFDEFGYFRRELLEPLRILPKSAPTPPHASSSVSLKTASPQSQLAVAPVFGGNTAAAGGDVRSRLGTRPGPPPPDKPNPFGGIPKPAMSMGSKVTPAPASLPPSASTFSFTSGQTAPPKGTFGLAAPPPFSFSQNSKPPATLTGVIPSNFTFASSASGPPQGDSNFRFNKPSGIPRMSTESTFSAAGPTPPPAFSFSSSQPDAAAAVLQLQKEKEAKLKIGSEVGVKVVGKILEEVIGKEVREVATLVRQEHLVRAAKEAIQRTLAIRIYKEVEDDVSHRLLRETAGGVLAKAQATFRASAKIETELRQTVVSELIREIAQEVFNRETAEQNARMAKLNRICSRIHLRSWFLAWKDAAEERKSLRIQELQRQKWNLENFPPILASQLPTARILQDWGASSLPLAQKPILENSVLNLVERAMVVKRSFEKHVEEFKPSVIHHLAAPLLTVLNTRAPLPRICTPFHPPLAINVVLFSEFDPWDHLANWVWESLSEDSEPLGDPNYISHRIPLGTNDQSHLTFQKCSDMGRASSDSWGVLGFLQSKDQAQHPRTDPIDQLRSFIDKNPTVPMVLFNSSRSSEGEIRNRLRLPTTPLSSSPGHVTVLSTSKGQVIENIPTLVDGLHWLAHSMELGPPAVPPIIILPFMELVAALFKDVYPIRVKGLICPLQLFREHNTLVRALKSVVENPQALAILKKWPGRASKLLIQKYSKSICFPHEEGRLGVVIKNLNELLGLLEIYPPEELIQKCHDGIRLRSDEIGAYFKKFLGNLMDGYQVSDNLRTRFNYSLSLQLKSPGVIQWREFLAVCQECVLEKLLTVPFASYQVCVDLDEVVSLGLPENSSKCPHCTSFSGRKRGFSLDRDFTFLSPKNKSVRQDSAGRTLLKDIRSLLQDMKEEKELLEASFTTHPELEPPSYLS